MDKGQMPIAPRDLVRTPGYAAWQLKRLQGLAAPAVPETPKRRDTGIDWWLPRVVFGGTIVCLVVLAVAMVLGGRR